MLKPGDHAPDFRLLGQDGKPHSLSDLTQNKLIVLYFYPKDETLGCIAEACAFRDSYEDFVEAGAEVVGVSGDSVESHQGFAGTRKLPFLLLSDPDLAVHRAYGADAGFLGLFKSRITFVIDQTGIIRHVFSSVVAPKKHASDSLQALKKIKSMAKST